jgi:hypothetical protein
MAGIHKGYCVGCPFDIGEQASEMAYNLWRLLGTGEMAELCDRNTTRDPGEPGKLCCGYFAHCAER